MISVYLYVYRYIIYQYYDSFRGRMVLLLKVPKGSGGFRGPASIWKVPEVLESCMIKRLYFISELQKVVEGAERFQTVLEARLRCSEDSRGYHLSLFALSMADSTPY